jgi:hypothetical protein
MKRFFSAVTSPTGAKRPRDECDSSAVPPGPTAAEGPSSFLSWNVNGAVLPHAADNAPVSHVAGGRTLSSFVETLPTRTGLAARLEGSGEVGGWSLFKDKVVQLDPDIIALQEVREEREPTRPSVLATP